MKKLTKTGNSLALVLDKDLLERTGINAETPLEISTNGDVILVTPVRSKKREEKLRTAAKKAHERYGGVFKKLAE